MEFIKNFQSINKNDVAFAGGKGASLGEMKQASISVPGGFVILSSAFEKFLDETDLNVEIDAILDLVNHKEMHTVENASEKIQALILEAEIPKAIAEEIQKFFKKLGTKYVAIRSSATAEDSVSTAWAGQLESYLNTTQENLFENINKCWASLFTPRAIFYRFEKDLQKHKISVAVVVQRMIDSEKSGIAFSVHPVTQDRNQLIIEAGFGLGEAIVGGEITPDSYVVEKESRRVIDKNVQTQARGLFRAKNGGNEWRNIPKEQREKQVLSDQEIYKLSEMILKIENHYGFACDIEWAFENGKFYVVQSRPITTLSPRTRQNKNQRIIEFINTNKWARLGNWKSTILVNELATTSLTKKYLRSIGFDFGINKVLAINDDYYISREDYDKIFDFFYQSLRDDYHYLDFLAKKLDEISNSVLREVEKSRNIEQFFKSIQKVMSIGVAMVPLDSAIERFLKDCKYNSKLQEVIFPIRQAFMIDERVDLLRIKLKESKGLNVLVDIQEHTKRFGWMNTVNWRLDPFDEKHYENQLANLNLEISEKELQTLLDKKVAEKRVKNFLKNKNRKTKDILMYLRKLLDAKMLNWDVVGVSNIKLRKLLKDSDSYKNLKYNSIIYLTSEEIIRINNHEISIEKLGKLLKQRKDGKILIYRDKHIEIYPSERGVLAQIKLNHESGNAKDIKGSPAFRGIVIGKVKIILSPKDSILMPEGYILVCPMTNPDFMPAVVKSKAIITDEGGMLCHAAIVSREFKKPCITGTKNATKILRDGDKIEVDANTGIVKILKRSIIPKNNYGKYKI